MADPIGVGRGSGHLPRLSHTFGPRRAGARRNGSLYHPGSPAPRRALCRAVFRLSLGGLLGVPRGIKTRKYG